jgi:phospholipid/cholesterol/gamma-HCH transport system ATP-binding protein
MSGPVLELEAARAEPGSSPVAGAMTLRLEPGDLALVRADDPAMARALALFCAGLVKLRDGTARFLGQDWSGLRRRPAQALRGRIGLAPGDGGWLPHLTVAEGMLLSRRHHDDTPDAALRDQADALSRQFGLPGMPLVHPAELSRADLARAGCARAFLGKPALVLLESPLDRETADALAEPLLAALEPARARGAAILWSTRSRRAWETEGFPATQWWELQEDGLCPAPP